MQLSYPSIILAWSNPQPTCPCCPLFIPNPSHPKQLWSPLHILHPILTRSLFNPHLNLILRTPPLPSPHVTGRPSQLSGRLAALPLSQPVSARASLVNWAVSSHASAARTKVKQVLIQLREMHWLHTLDYDLETQENSNLPVYTSCSPKLWLWIMRLYG